MKRTILLLILCVCACAYSLPALGWGQEGHRIIAKIAYDHMSKKAKQEVDGILGVRGMIYWANWPDEIKSDTIYKQSIKDGWHYQDFAGGMSDSLIADALIHYPAEGGNLYRALDSIEKELRMEKGKLKNPHTLRFMVHLSGDRYRQSGVFLYGVRADDRGYVRP